MKPDSNPYWEAILEHLEDQWPRRLERLLRLKKLRAYLDNQAQLAVQADASLARENPEAEDDQIQETVLGTLLEKNHQYDPDNPEQMSPTGKALLGKFWEDILDEAESE